MGNLGQDEARRAAGGKGSQSKFSRPQTNMCSCYRICNSFTHLHCRFEFMP